MESPKKDGGIGRCSTRSERKVVGEFNYELLLETGACKEACFRRFGTSAGRLVFPGSETGSHMTRLIRNKYSTLASILTR